MLEHRVGYYDIGKHVTIFDQVDLVQCKVVVDNEHFVDGLADFNFVVLVITHGHHLVNWSCSLEG